MMTLMIMLPMFLMLGGSWIYYNMVFKGFAQGFENRFGIKLNQWPLWLMFGTFILVFAIPYVFRSFDPINLIDEDGGGGGNSFLVIVKLLLASLPAAGISCWMIQKKTGQWSTSLIATGVTLLAAFALMSYCILMPMLILVKWLAMAIFGFGLSEGTASSAKSVAVHRCSNCHAEVTAGASFCPGCGTSLN